MRRARAVAVGCGLAVAAGIAVIGYVYRLRAPGPEVSGEHAAADGNDSGSSGLAPLGSVFGQNSPAPPPIVFSVGPSGDEGDGPDLSTPAAAVHSVLCLMDEGATDELASCFVEGAESARSSLYPRCLGHPVGLAEVVEDDASAKVVWEATVHTGFSRGGKPWSPGERITLTARVVRVDGLWKVLRLHEGEDDGPTN